MAEQGNASDQTRLGLMYDLDWDVPHDNREGVSWKPVLIGAGIGFAAGFGIGWLAYEMQKPAGCVLFTQRVGLAVADPTSTSTTSLEVL